jgi:hypothetical protein
MNYPIDNLIKFNNIKYKWSSFWGNPCVWNTDTDEWVMQIEDGRIYFNSFAELNMYPTTKIYTDLDEAKIVCACIINSHF